MTTYPRVYITKTVAADDYDFYSQTVNSSGSYGDYTFPGSQYTFPNTHDWIFFKWETRASVEGGYGTVGLAAYGGLTDDQVFRPNQTVRLNNYDGGTTYFFLARNLRIISSTITYDANGGINTMTPSNVTYNTTFTFQKNGFTKTGYTFSGWWLYEGTTIINQITYSSEQVYGTWTLAGTNYTAKAQWTVKTSTISYVANGGINTMTPSNVTYNTTFTFQMNGFTRTGYTFSGWHLYEGSTRINQITYSSGQVYGTWTLTETNYTAIAQWTAKTSTITYVANEGTNTMTPITVTYNTTFTFADNLFTRTGYSFNGWHLYDGDTNTRIDQTTYANKVSYGTWLITTNNIRAIAQWTATSTISYFANGGINTMTPSTVTYNTIFTFADNLFTRTGYTFSGWHLYDGDTNMRIDLYTYANQESSRWLITTNIIRAIAQWTAKEYTITYSANPVQVALYSFTTHTFTNAGATGRTGPILLDVRTAYSAASWAQSTSPYLNMVTQGIQEWTVPATGNYTIEVAGAAGGGATTGTLWIGGKGACMKGTFYLTQGMVLSILVGQRGVKKFTTGNCNNGGGGGTFVWDKSSTTQPLIVGGGGGGSSFSNAYNGLDAPITQNGTGRFGNAFPGTNGNGANPGGSGWLSNGTSGFLDNNSNNTKPLEGGLGGAAAGNNNAGDGGFGGGASGSGNLCTAGGPGGGGGYSGGAGPSGDETLYGSAGGGGSYNGADIQNQINTAGVNTGHGYVIIIFLSSPYKATYGNNFTFQTNNFTKTGYGFSGWHLYEGTTRINPTSTYAGGHEMIWNIDKNLTAVAQWVLKTSLITYTANGGEGTLATNPQTATYSVSFTFQNNTNNFTRTGYDFKEWYLYEGETTTTYLEKYNAGQSYGTWDKTGEKYTAQAQWTAKTYILTYNGGNGGTGSMTISSVIYVDVMTFKNNEFARTGYVFYNWELYDIYNNYLIQFGAGDLYSWSITGNVTAKAQWTAKEYTITYNGNENTGGSTSNSRATYDSPFTFQNNGFTRTGYEFSGWYLYEVIGTTSTRINIITYGLTTTSYSYGTWNIDKNLTAQAQWTLSEFTVTFNTNGKGGANGTGYTKEIKQNYNTIVTCPIVKAVGYVFGGWATSVISTIVDKADNDIFTLGAANQNFFAIWAVNTNGIRFSELQSVFGGSHQISMSEYRTESGQTIANSEIRLGIHLKGKSRLS